MQGTAKDLGQTGHTIFRKMKPVIIRWAQPVDEQGSPIVPGGEVRIINDDEVIATLLEPDDVKHI